MSCPPLDVLLAAGADGIAEHLTTCEACADLAARVVERAGWQIEQLNLLSGATIDVYFDGEGSVRCGDRRCRQMQVQSDLFGGGETLRCRLLDAAPSPPPNDYCGAYALEVALIVDRARRRRREGAQI